MKKFEATLPENYKISHKFSIKNKKLIFIGGFVAVCALVFFLGLIPAFISKSAKPWYENISVGVVIWIAFGAILIHHYIHLLSYQLITKNKIGTDPLVTCFVYRKSYILISLAPTALLIAIFVPTLILAWVKGNYFIYYSFLLTFALVVAYGINDYYVLYLLLKKYTKESVIVNNSGPFIGIFELDENSQEQTDEATMRYIEEHEGRVKTNQNNEKKNAILLLVVGLIFCAIGFAIGLAITLESYFGLMYENPYPIYKMISFWVALINFIEILFFALTFKRLENEKGLILVMKALFGIVVIFVMCFFVPLISYTNDINNYGAYDSNAHLPEYFPEKITEEMIPVEYSYYYDASWDWCYELYLEVKMTDREYARYKEKYSDSVECWYDNRYTEYVISDDLNYSEWSSYADNPTVEKIIFNDAEKTVIFWALYGPDLFKIENSQFFKKFEVSAQKYKEMTSNN